MFSILQTTQLGQPPFSLSTDNKSSFGETHDFLSCLTARNVSSNTVRAYAYDLMAFYRFMSITKVNIQNITTRHITQFLLFEQSSKISPRTINRRIVAIRSFLNSKSPDLGNKLFSSKLMGHADIETTLIYVNLSLSDVASEYHKAMNIIKKQHA